MEPVFSSRDYFFFDFLRGTFPPARRASERPIAIACLRLFTFFPDRPLFSLPRLRSCIARLTFCCAFFPYLAIGFLLSLFKTGNSPAAVVSAFSDFVRNGNWRGASSLL